VQAAPASLTHSGRVLGTDGTPLNGPVTVTVSLFDEQTSCAAFWGRTYMGLDVQDGYYAVSLVLDDLDQPLDPADFSDGNTWVAVTINGGVMGPRAPLASVPYAMVAGNAGLLQTTDFECSTEGTLAWNPDDDTLIVCNNAGTYSVVGDFTVEALVLDDRQFPDVQSVGNQGWSCNHASPWTSSSPDPSMHLHNFPGAECSRDVDSLIAGSEYRLSMRMYSRGTRVNVIALDASGNPTGVIHSRLYDSLVPGSSSNYGVNVLAQVLFDAPDSGRIRLTFDDPAVNDGGVTHIDLRTNQRPTAPHAPFVNQNFTNALDVFVKGWDVNHGSPIASGHMHLHNYCGNRAHQYVQVVPGEAYDLTFHYRSAPGRVDVFSSDKASNDMTGTLASHTFSSGDGNWTETFTAPASGWILVQFSDPSVGDF
jgi:hypothetical protein